MKLRLVIITILFLICSSYADDATFFHLKDNQNDAAVEMITNGDDSEIDIPRQNIILPRQTDYTSQTNTRTVSRRNTLQRLQQRFVFSTLGKSVETFIENYRIAFRHCSSGLLTPFRHHLSLGRLII